MAITLANSYATRYSFIIKKFANIVYQIFKIKLQCLIKFKQIQKFDNRVTKSIIHAIYFIFIISTYIKNLAPLLISKLRNYLIILSQTQIKKHKVIIHITNNFELVSFIITKTLKLFFSIY